MRPCWSAVTSEPQSTNRCSTARWASVSAALSFDGRIALPLGDVPAALVGDPPLLLGEHRQRVRAREGEVLLELGGPNLRLLREHRVEAGLAALDLLVERAHRAPHPHVGGDRDRGGDAGDDGGGDGGVGHGI